MQLQVQLVKNQQKQTIDKQTDNKEGTAWHIST